jgi:trans-aconitate 2-methyltransferase
MSDAWSPTQYNRYAEQRRQPFFDLVALLPSRPGRRIVDLGCGTGEMTQQLHQRTRARTTLGLDSSAAMLAKSAAFAGGGLSFERRDIADFGALDGPIDLIFSNAALQWIDDHEALFARLVGALGPGGELAVQMPSNHDHPSHRIAAEIALEPAFRASMPEGPRRTPVLSAVDYSNMLHGLGLADTHVRLQVYGHELPSRDDVVEWVRGTLLTHYEARIDAARWPAFLDRYRQRLYEVTPDDRPYFFPFPRILLWGRKA